MKRSPLTRDEMISVIEGRTGAPRIPMLISTWVFYPDEFGDRKPELFKILSRYPTDAQVMFITMPDSFDAPADDPSYRWLNFDDPYKGKSVPFDHRIGLTDWTQLDGVLADFPNPHYRGLFKNARPADGRYRLGIWWDWLFEKHWRLRGMTNALMDYHDHPEEVHRLFRAITDFYLVVVERAKEEAGLDGIMISDDLGTQRALFFSPKMLHQFHKAYYKEVIDKAHSLGLQIWLHACGCVEAALPMFVELGLDVVHPIQKHTMDYQTIANKFGKDLCICAGLDVQQVIPWGTPEEVRQEVRLVTDTFWRPDEGRLILSAGNAIHEDCPLPNMEAMLDEAYQYGTKMAKPSTGRTL